MSSVHSTMWASVHSAAWSSRSSMMSSAWASRPWSRSSHNLFLLIINLGLLPLDEAIISYLIKALNRKNSEIDPSISDTATRLL